MSTINDNFIQAEFALASYGTFGVGVIPLEILTGNDVGMSVSQAEQFSATYRVAAQYTDAGTGLSATVFQDSAGKKYLAIRGTQASGTDLTADGLLALYQLKGSASGFFFEEPPCHIRLALLQWQLLNQRGQLRV